MSRIESEDQPRKQDPRIIEDWITIGSLLLKNGESEEAMKYFKRAELTEKDIEAVKKEWLTEQEKIKTRITH